jgi:predicted CXXCH cytochrome family protein
VAALPRVALAALALGAAAAAFLLLSRPPEEPAPSPPRYADSAACAACHSVEARRWAGSDHDRAMEIASDATVLGDFDDAEVVVHGVTTRFARREGRRFVTTESETGAPREYEVRYAFGVDPLQQYLIEFPGGRFQCLPLGWATKERRWVHLYEEPIRPDDPLFWTGPMQNWNFMCAECHSTELRRGYDAVTGEYRTTWHEIDVGCQACHGPGAEHIRWAKEDAGREHDRDPEKGFVVRFKGGPSAREVDACGRCHARRSLVDDEYRHGAPFLDHYDPQLLTEPHYHADGQVDDEVYEYGSFLQTKKHRQGVRCTDCHDPHSAMLRAEGNALCVRCHSPSPDPRFPTLKAKAYDTLEHSHHAPGTPGSRCVDCHMPSKTYMRVDPRRDHSFRVPRPDLTVVVGTPNACAACHEEKGAAWAATAVEGWFPRPSGEPRPTHFAVAMAAARDGRPGASAGLAALAQDPAQSAIARATALARLERTLGPEVWEAVEMGLADPEGLVRAAAVDLAGAVIPRGAPSDLAARKVDWLAPLLDDPLRLVRVRAARALSEVGEAAIPVESREAYRRALAEHVRRQEQLADRADGPFNLAVLRENERKPEEAEALYGRALGHDPDFVPALVNRAILRSASGRLAEAEADLRRAVAVAPSVGENWYSLGLLLAERNDMEGAQDALVRAAALLPSNARVRMNLGLVARARRRPDEARRALEEGARLAGNDPDPVLALIDLLVSEERYDEAERLASDLAPRIPAAREILDRIRAARPR